MRGAPSLARKPDGKVPPLTQRSSTGWEGSPACPGFVIVARGFSPARGRQYMTWF